CRPAATTAPALGCQGTARHGPMSGASYWLRLWRPRSSRLRFRRLRSARSRWLGRPSDSPHGGAAEHPLRRREQNHDEQGEYGDGREDPPDQEIRGLLKQAQRQPADDRTAIVAETAERYRHEAVEIEQRAVGEEGEQQFATGKSGDA